MKLFSGPLSLYARKVEIALREKAIAFERIMVPFTQEAGYRPRNSVVMVANPKGQVPVLQDGDLTLYDSTVILEYLEDACPGPALMPATPAERARCRQLRRETFRPHALQHGHGGNVQGMLQRIRDAHVAAKHAVEVFRLVGGKARRQVRDTRVRRRCAVIKSHRIDEGFQG